MQAVEPEIVQVIVGTAGHVDHGKTALVRLLTGCDTDRLPEEKERGLSIDLGFAPCRLPGNRVVGIVDVPGHEDFIRNMVAGAASVDVLMLVVAADDGIMPQTVEHLRIVKLLRTAKVMAVITKIDLVEPDVLEVVKEEVAEFLARSGFSGAPVVLMSNVTGTGLREVRRTLDELIRVVARVQSPSAFRMPIERVFSAKGYGTVVTGIPVSGTVQPGDSVELHPAGARYDVRAIQAYRHDIAVGPPNSCVAVNLRDLDSETVARGMTLAYPGVYKSTTSAIASIGNVSDSLKLPGRSEVKFHAGTSRVGAMARLVGSPSLGPGEESFLLLKLEEPVVLAAGDRYIIRILNPHTTLGGGVVLSTGELSLRRPPPDLADLLAKALDAANRGDYFACEYLAGPQAVFSRGELLRLTQMIPSAAERALKDKTLSGEIADLGGGSFMVREKARAIAASLKKELARYHRGNPYAWGMEPSHACRIAGVDQRAFAKLADLICADGDMAVRHGRLALAEFRPALSAQQMQLKERVKEMVDRAGLSAAARGNILEELCVGEADMKLITRILADEGSVKVVGTHLMQLSLFEECRRKLVDLFATKAVVTIPEFRAVTGVSRNLAVAILEVFDAEGFTHRVSEGRVLVKPKSR
jgi:selenocysteine-specific elongation factor